MGMKEVVCEFEAKKALNSVGDGTWTRGSKTALEYRRDC